jgi:Tfp pilus assembly protein PilF
MSLLLDALKRAEQEKHARVDRPAGAREPVAPPPHATESLTLAPIASVQAAANGAGALRGDSTAQAQAQTLFQAKSAAVENPRAKGMLWIVLAVVILVTAAAGTYVWFSLKALAPITPAPTVRRPPAAPTPLPASSERAPFVPALATPPATTPATAPEPLVASAPKPAPVTRESLVRDLVSGARSNPAPANAPVALVRSPDTPRVAAPVAAGYEALRSGDLPLARRHYESALASDPRGLDAVLGLATVEAQGGNRGAAAQLYRRALDIDPRNGTALAALAALVDYARPEALEPQLREDIARNPGNAMLHFALGNLYSAQSRWNEAQAAYFEAHRMEPASADIAHNLAVSLDRLGKATLAADYYRRALAGAAPHFDRHQVSRRLAELGAAR